MPFVPSWRPSGGSLLSLVLLSVTGCSTGGEGTPTPDSTATLTESPETSGTPTSPPLATAAPSPTALPPTPLSPTPPATATPSPTPVIPPTLEPSPTPDLVQPGESLTGPLEYGYLFWPTNFEPWTAKGTKSTVRHVQTGYYGMAFNVASASPVRLGPLTRPVPVDEALIDPNAVIDALPTLQTTYSASLDGAPFVATGFLSSTGDATNPSQLIDQGYYMQRLEIPSITFAGTTALSGRMKLSAMPRHFVLSYKVSHAQADPAPLSVSMALKGEALSRYPNTEWLEQGRAVSLSNDAGEGWTWYLPDVEGATFSITRSAPDTLTFTASVQAASPGIPVALEVGVIPSNALSESVQNVWFHPHQDVTVAYTQLYRDGTPVSALKPATWESERGLMRIDLGNMTDIGGKTYPNWNDPSDHTFYNRHLITITNNTDQDMPVPLAFDGGQNASYSITGTSATLRDVNGEPLGVPVQISKNWHETPYWFHFYTQLVLGPGTHTLELTLAHARWGEVYAAAHAQLCLIGWGTNQQWDESSLGGWGESITYDPDLTLRRAMVDDVRPFLVNTSGEWRWTGNVGGADSLVYVNSAGVRDRLGRLRTRYAETGPNQTRVSYAGITSDGKIEGQLTTLLGRTDDVVRVYYQLSYTFLQEVSYNRLAFFQVAADNYSDNGFQSYAYGSADEVLYEGVVPSSGASGYASESERGIELAGDSPWIMLFNNTLTSGNLPEHLANVGFIIRDYEAVLGGERITTPHINLVRTNNSIHQIAFELGIPYTSTARIVPAGSTFRATIEYVVPPSVQTAYYGQSDYLLALPADTFQSPELMQFLATENDLNATSIVGTVTGTWPVEIDVVRGTLAAQLILEGGLGFTPLTFHGLVRPEGWRLEQWQEGGWVQVNQEVEGNDYWQAAYNPSHRTWSLTL